MATPPAEDPHSSPSLSFRSGHSPTQYTQDGEGIDAVLDSMGPQFATGKAARTSPKRFNAVPEDLSGLGDGYAFQPKVPNHPGQFSVRPKQILAGLQTESFSPDAICDQRLVQPQNLSQHLPKEPVDLHEIGITSKQSFQGPGSPDNSTAQPVGHGMPPQPEIIHATPQIPQRPPAGQLGGDGLVEAEVADSQAKVPERTVVGDENTEGNRQSLPGLCSVSRSQQGTTSSFNAADSPALSVASPSETMGTKAPAKAPRTSMAKKANAIKVAPHTLREASSQRSSSPVSACGDLSSPTRRPVRERKGSTPRQMVSRPMTGQDHSVHQVHGDRHRSQSRASNVSRKRTTIHKHVGHAQSQSQHRRCPDRKAMMNEMALHWNEYLEMADQEREDARIEIASLQEDMMIQAAELKHAVSELRHKEQSFEEVQQQCESLRSSHQKAIADRELLSTQVDTLETQMGTTQDCSKQALEKNRACRTKVNEAIQEHQSLYNHSRGYYSELKAKLIEEREERQKESERISEAIRKSAVQRKVMKNTIAFVQNDVKARDALKDEVIAGLQARVVEQQQSRSCVQFMEESMKTQLRGQQDTQREVHELKSALSTIARVYGRESDERALLETAVTQVEQKLEDIAERLDSTPSDTLDKHDLEALMEDTRDHIVSDIRASLDIFVNRQEYAEEAIASIESTLRMSVENLREELVTKISQEAKTNKKSEALEQFISVKCDQIGVELRSTQRSTEKIQRRLDSMMTEGNANANAAVLRLNETQRQLEKREFKISDLQRQLQLVSEDYAAKAEAMLDQIQVSEDAQKSTQCNLERMTEELEARLDTALKGERDSCEAELRAVETDHITKQNSLQNSLNEAQSKLAIISAHICPDIGKLREELREKQAMVDFLEEQTAKSVTEAEANERLRVRWRQDITAIDQIRAQLKSLDKRFPKIESIGQSFEKVVQFHDLLGNAAEYLSREHDWIQKQLHAGSLPERNVHHGGPDKMITEVLQGARLQPEIEEEQEASLGTSQKHGERRRVIVKSPAGSIGSPSPPPSVEQEQKRRRAGHDKRPILRGAAAPPNKETAMADMAVKAHEVIKDREAGGLGTATFDVAGGYSRYNRPVSSSAPATLLGAAGGVINKIRENLVRNQGRAWASLPSLADFQASTQREDNGQGGKRASGPGISESEPKRIKFDPQDTS